MPKIRYLKLRFDQPIYPYDIPRFRAAVIEKTKRESALFHNHTEEGVIYRYPLIQYKVARKKACIVCLNSGSDDIHFLLQNRDLTLRVGDMVADYSIEDIEMRYHQVQTWQNTFTYSILNWLALNQRNHEKFQALEHDASAQIEFLEKILRGNILSFAKGIDWFVEEQLMVTISKIEKMKLLNFKGKQMLAITLQFQSNVSLPDYIGLGKGSSVGFGVVRKINKHENKNSNER